MKIDRKIHKIDAADQILGRLATKVSILLRGKHKVAYLPTLDNGDIVEIANINKIKVTGNKAENKVYYRHSGYIGGLKSTSLKDMLSGNPKGLFRKSVYKMLPDNKTRDIIIKRLKIN